MQYGGLFQTGNQGAGGWRFDYNDRPTSNAALQQVPTIDPEFLKKVAGMKPEEKKGLLDAALTAQPLQGLLDTGGGAQGIGNEGVKAGSGYGGNWSTNEAGNRVQQVSPGGFNLGMNPAKSGLGFLTGGLPGLLAGMTAQQTAPVFEMAPAGIADYGTSMNANGPTTEAQAKALADQLAQELAQYQSGGGLFGGSYGGYGGVTGGSDTMGFGGEY